MGKIVTSCYEWSEVKEMGLPKSRFDAFAVHFGISVLIFMLLFAVIFYCWFPGALFASAGGWDGIKIVAGVDLVLGPSLTFIIYNFTKPVRELVRDLSVIATFQLLCLGVGIYLVFDARPLAVVHVFDTLYSFNGEAYTALGLDSDVLESIPGAYPKKVYVDVPLDKANFLNEHVKGLLNGERPLQERPDLYKAIPADPDKVRALLHAKVDVNGCLRVDIETAYKKGTVCVDPVTMGLSGFIEQ